jgi:DNA-binding MarR family transcriptional regulator
LTSVLDRLEGRSLLTRSTDPENRRSVIVTLTRTGSALAKRVFETLSTFERQTLQKYSAAEIEVFRRVIAAFSAAT